MINQGNFLVLGLGNLLMNDDAAGLRAVYTLQERYPDRENLQIVDGGTLGLDLLGHVAWADKLLLLDAININEAPGTVALIAGDDINPVLSQRISPHQVGLKDLLEAAELIGDRPPEVELLGIQYDNINMEMTLSEEVERGLPRLIAAASERIETFISNSSDS
ncbi:MAG: hydrogenase maturation protease [Pelovirga sp.]